LFSGIFALEKKNLVVRKEKILVTKLFFLVTKLDMYSCKGAKTTIN
jgi:hypothetical protein